MKRILAIVLVVAMLACMVPAFSLVAAAEESDVEFGLNADFYRLTQGDHETIRNVMPNGVNASGVQVGTADLAESNGCPADNAGNHCYDDTIDDLKALMTKVGSAVVPNYETKGFEVGYNYGMPDEDFMVEYNGYVTVSKGGTYQFGTNKVDNCLFVELEINGTWTTVYEFWAKNVWNDNGTTYYGTTVDLKEGESYKIHVVFMEINGGQAIESNIKIEGEPMTLANSGLVFTTTKPAAPVGPVTVSFFSTGSDWYYMTSGEYNDEAPDEGWETDASIYSAWRVGTADLADEWDTDDAASRNQSLWAVKEFDVEDLDLVANWALMTEMFYDDNLHLYINGVEVFVGATWNDGLTTYKFVEKASSVLKEGKNVIAVSLVQGHGGFGLDLSLYATRENTSAYAPTLTLPLEIDTPEELLDFVATVNANPAATVNMIAHITGNIDMTGKAWTPMSAFYGRIEGHGNTISGITYKPTVDATDNESNDGVAVGLFVNALANTDNIKGQIVDLKFDKCALEINGTDGDETRQYIMAGIVAGIVDRGYISNCTVSNSTVKGATAAGAIAGVACWAYDTAGVYVQNCIVENTTVNARLVAGGIIGYARGGDAVIINNSTFTNVTLNAETTGKIYGDMWYGTENVIYEKPADKKDLTLEAGKDYQFYYQTRENADDDSLTDYRVVCIASVEWLRENYYKGFKISFTDGTTTKSFTDVQTEVYKYVYTELEDSLEMYGATGDTVVFGWVVTEVPEGFTPSATLGNLTLPE